jgi:hypothetical protein
LTVLYSRVEVVLDVLTIDIDSVVF